MQLLRNFLSLAGGEVFSKLLTLVALGRLARVVGPTGFGYLEFAASAAFCAGLLVDQGFGLYGAREIARDRSSTATARLVSQIVLLRFFLAVLAFAGIALLAYLIHRERDVKQLMLIYGLSLFFLPLMLQWVFQGHDRMQVVAVLQIVRQAVFAAGVLLLVRDAGTLWPAAMAEVAGLAAMATLSLWMYRSYLRGHLTFHERPSLQLVRHGATIGLSQIFWSMKMFGATVVLGLTASGSDLGYFGAAMRILLGLHAFVFLYFFNLLPSLSRKWLESREDFAQLIGQSFHLVGWLSLGSGVLWVLLARWATRLTFGESFSPASSVLQCMSAVCVLAAIHGHFRFALIAANRQKQEMVTSLVGAVVALSFIPVGYARHGILGAALAMVAGELAVWVTSAYFCHRELRLPSYLGDLARPALSAGLILGACWMACTSSTPIALQAGLVLFALIAAAYLSDRRIRHISYTLAVTAIQRPG